MYNYIKFIYQETKLFIDEYKKSLFIGFSIWYLLNILHITNIFYAEEFTPRVWALGHISSLVLLLIFSCLTSYVYKSIKLKDPFVLRAVYLAKIYFFVSAALIFILWPGTWNWDDLWSLDSVRHGGLAAWQHVLTGYWMHTLVCILPMPAGIIILQVFISGILASYIVTLVEFTYNINHSNTVIHSVLKLFIFFTPPVIMYLYSGYRMGIYVFFELFVFTFFICYHGKWNNSSFIIKILCAFLIVIISTWRTESFIYIVIFMLILATEKSISKLERSFIIAFAIIVYSLIAYNQKINLGNDNYEIISTARPLVAAVVEANKNGYFNPEDQLLINDIDKVVNVKNITDTKENGEKLYWDKKLVRKGYTHEQYKEYLKAFFKLSLRYWKAVCLERWDIFNKSVSFFKKSHVQNVKGAKTLLPDNKAKELYYNAQYPLALPIIAKVRTKFINSMDVGYSDNNNWFQKAIYTFFWSPAIEIAIFIGLFIYSFIKRNWFISILTSGLIFKLAIICLTSPAPWYMYFHSYLFMGQFLVVMWLFNKYGKHPEIKVDDR